MRFLILISIIAISVLSCKKDQKSNEVQIVESHEPTEELVSLDNGNLWKANIETTIGINKMIKRMGSFSKGDDIKSYSSLKDSLESDFTMIFQRCTMKGEAHNQLHNFLKPMVILFEGLKSEDLVTCKSSFNELEQHLKLYENYFE
jgi:hypothetical protein